MFNDEPEKQKPIIDYNYYSDEEDQIKDKEVELIEKNESQITNFGKKGRMIIDHKMKNQIKGFNKTQVIDDSDDESSIIGPCLPSINKKHLDNFNIPIKNSIELTHTKGKDVTSVDVDKNGLLMISSSGDGSIKFWDYLALDRSKKSTKTISVCEDYSISNVEFNSTGGFILCCTSDSQAKIYRRDGNFEVQCFKGDLYMSDINQTKGHTLPICDGHFHPREKHLFITSSRDSTIRLWDMNSPKIGVMRELKQNLIFRAKTLKNHKIAVNSCTYSSYGNSIIGGVNDGSLQIWDIRKNYKPDIVISNAHINNETITKLNVLEDNYTIISRGSEDKVKVYDIRNYSKPTFELSNLPYYHDKSSMSVSPCESVLLVLVSVNDRTAPSNIKFFDIKTFSEISELKVCSEILVSSKWSQALNQIIIGSNEGRIVNYYNPSNDDEQPKGIEIGTFKKIREKEVDDFKFAQPIFTPLEGPLFDTEYFDSKELKNTLIPEIEQKSTTGASRPIQGPNSKGFKSHTLLQSVENIHHRKLYEDIDIVQLLQKYDNVNNESAYKNTMPKSIFDTTTKDEKEVEYYKKIDRKTCTACGLKNCTCNRTIFQREIKKK